jgi:hypothetical protein
MPKLSRKELCVESLPKLADALAKNEEFQCSIVAKPSPDRGEILDAIIRKTASSVGYPVSSEITCISQSFVTASHDPCDRQCLLMQPGCRRCSQSTTTSKSVGIISINVSPSAPASLSTTYTLAFVCPGDIPIIELDPLPTPYPPEGHIVPEQHYPTLPPPPKKRDPTCSYLYNYCRLNEFMLQYTLDADKEAIFVDKATQKPILVVLRDFAKDYDIIQP